MQKILKDPNLSRLATFKFADCIDAKRDDKLLAEGCDIGEMMKLGEADEGLTFELELVGPNLDQRKMKPGNEIKRNREVPT